MWYSHWKDNWNILKLQDKNKKKKKIETFYFFGSMFQDFQLKNKDSLFLLVQCFKKNLLHFKYTLTKNDVIYFQYFNDTYLTPTLSTYMILTGMSWLCQGRGLAFFYWVTTTYGFGEIIVYSRSTINAYSLLSHEWRDHHSYERRKYAFMVLWEYLIIFHGFDVEVIHYGFCTSCDWLWVFGYLVWESHKYNLF